MNLTPYILFSLAALFVGAAATLTMPYSKRTIGWVSLAFQTMAGAGFLYVALQVLAHGTFNPERPLFTVAGLGAAFLLKVDALSAVFLLAITVVSWAAGLYSIEYIKHYKESLARYYPLFLLFLLGMYGVVVVRDLFFFIVFWEFMTLTSYGLVVYEWGNRTNVNAGFKYFLMTHIGTAGIIVAANTLYHYSQSFDLESLAPVMALLRSDNPALLHTILLLFFIGFATKAGIFPFGDWLPDAHPAAPAPVSAILSGVMIKMGIYGILRVFLGMLPVSGFSSTWGNIFAVFGTISLFIGTMTAMFQHDAKRVLAFHSIGQNGYILLAIGAGLLLAPVSPPLCAIALVAGLYHLVNHAMFKSLLFLTAGSLQYKTGTRDLDRMGGLGKYMPLTAAAAIVAALGISGVPPFNGFASKWLIYHGTVTAGLHTPILLLAGLIALFTSLLTMASVMVKYVGLAFLGQRLPHNQGVERDVPAGMALPQFLLAALVLLQGVLVVPIVRLHRVLQPGVPAGGIGGAGAGGLAVLEVRRVEAGGDGPVVFRRGAVAAGRALLRQQLLQDLQAEFQHPDRPLHPGGRLPELEAAQGQETVLGGAPAGHRQLAVPAAGLPGRQGAGAVLPHPLGLPPVVPAVDGDRGRRGAVHHVRGAVTPGERRIVSRSGGHGAVIVSNIR
ncbi:MAG: oxidoreductase [Candidatus Edwardsbacteria bacterium]|nr:oxidoreductase [Candidatus Edwardsbacteria bacterium]